MIPEIAARGAKERLLFTMGQGLGADVGHGGLLSATIHAWAGREVKVQVERAGTTYRPAELGSAAPEIAGWIAHCDGFLNDRFPNPTAHSTLAKQPFVHGARA